LRKTLNSLRISFLKIINLFLLYGDERSGKKYILNSFINCFHFDKKIFYASLEDDYFSEQILEGISYFDVIVLDRLDLAPTDSNWELGIFNLYNELNEADKNKIIFLSDKPLNSIEFNLKDLQSRISSISAMSFAELDDEEKRILMELIFNKRGISIDNSVLSYALERSSRNLENIINLVQKIDEYSLSKKRNITVPLLKEILES